MATFSFDGVFDLDDALSMPPLHPTPIASSLSHDAVVTAETIVLTFPAAVTSNNDVVCSVCKEDFEPPYHGGRQIPCGHVYHADCIAAWVSVRDTCPLCRVVVVDQKTAHKRSSC